MLWVRISIRAKSRKREMVVSSSCRVYFLVKEWMIYCNDYAKLIISLQIYKVRQKLFIFTGIIRIQYNSVEVMIKQTLSIEQWQYGLFKCRSAMILSILHSHYNISFILLLENILGMKRKPPFLSFAIFKTTHYHNLYIIHYFNLEMTWQLSSDNDHGFLTNCNNVASPHYHIW
jgi:hypothetical protein